MVTLEQMRSSNARIAESLPAGLVAVFVGGTSGIGESTMKQLARRIVQPRIYFIGRSERAAARITAELTALNPSGKYRFIRADLSLLQNVDDVCRDIKRRETLINLLFLTPGTVITGKGNQPSLSPSPTHHRTTNPTAESPETPEALHYPTALTYYSRIRLIVNLLPLLQKATSLRRVVTVFGGTKEGALCTADLQGRTLVSPPSLSSPYPPSPSPPITTGVGNAAGSACLALRGHTASMMTLALESLALEAPDVSFVHSFPGFVRTNLGRDAARAARAASAMGLVKVVLNRVVGPMVPAVPVAEAGERQLFFATSGRFPARGGVDVEETAGVGGAEEGVGVARGSDAREGSGVYSVNFDGEPQGVKVEEVVQRMRDEDLVRRLWLHTVGEFVRVTGTEFV